MLSSVRFKFGSSPSADPLVLDPRPITVFVGPNNSGKSMTLRGIETWCRTGTPQPRNIVDEIDAELPDAEQALAELGPLRRRPIAGQVVPEGLILVGRSDPHQQPGYQERINLEHFISIWRARDWQYIGRYFLTFFTLRLDGKTRFSLTEPRPVGDLQEAAENHLVALFKDDEARKRIRGILAAAFGLYFVIDPTGITHFKIRLSEREPSDNAEEQALDERARSFHGAAADILELSDGVKAYTVIFSAVLSANYKIVLIDEPEAFLAPALRRQLGSKLATLAQERGGNLFAATHDADFLMGGLQAGSDVNVVRLTYSAGKPTARMLPPETLVRLMRDSLLRSTNVLSALFHEAAVVAEADTDRTFYQEINERLLVFDREGIDSCLFLNARNKQTVPTVAGPLRQMGIPAAMVLDIDALKDGGKEWTRLLDAANVPETSRDALNSHRAAVKKAFDRSGKDVNRDGGVAVLDGDAKESCNDLLDQLAGYGIFLVPDGELEAWLPELGVDKHGPDWLIEVFEKMGVNPRDPGYAKPQQAGVWAFVEKVGRWVQDENQKGMPQ
jgi:hypothetical protein